MILSFQTDSSCNSIETTPPTCPEQHLGSKVTLLNMEGASSWKANDRTYGQSFEAESGIIADSVWVQLVGIVDLFIRNLFIANTKFKLI